MRLTWNEPSAGRELAALSGIVNLDGVDPNRAHDVGAGCASSDCV